MKKAKVFFAFFAVLVLSCSSVFAIVMPKVFTKPLVEKQQEVTEAIESEETSTNSMPTMEDSENSSTGFELIDTVIDKIDEMGYMWPKKYESYKDEIKAELVAVADDIGRDIASLKKDLQREQRTHYMGEFNVLFNYDEGIRLGLGAALGVRLNNGLVFKGGVSYVGMKPADMWWLEVEFNPSNIVGQMSIGFEW